MGTAVKRKRTYNAALRQEQAQTTRLRILDAARRLLAKGTYSSVTMEDIAREAGVAYQTVYSVFGTKLRLAQEIIRVGFHFEDVEGLVAQLRASSDADVWFRIAAQIARRFNETCADLVRFMRESGDPDLLARYHQTEELRLSQQSFMPAMLRKSGRLRAGLSPSEALAVIWAMSGPDWYAQLVFQRGWTPSRYEEWLRDALMKLLLQPK